MRILPTLSTLGSLRGQADEKESELSGWLKHMVALAGHAKQVLVLMRSMASRYSQGPGPPSVFSCMRSPVALSFTELHALGVHWNVVLGTRGRRYVRMSGEEWWTHAVLVSLRSPA